MGISDQSGHFSKQELTMNVNCFNNTINSNISLCFSFEQDNLNIKFISAKGNRSGEKRQLVCKKRIKK